MAAGKDARRHPTFLDIEQLWSGIYRHLHFFVIGPPLMWLNIKDQT